MNILSLFNWASMITPALLKNKSINIDNFFYSEIDDYANACTSYNMNRLWITSYNLWDVRNVAYQDRVLMTWEFRLPNQIYDDLCGIDTTIDLLVWGSPCQDLSSANNSRKGLSWNKSWLFWEYLRILHEVKPKYFILENVASMPKHDKELISKELGVEPILINASSFSAQHRRRLFWTNIPTGVVPPVSNHKLKDILTQWGKFQKKPKEYDRREVFMANRHGITYSTTYSDIWRERDWYQIVDTNSTKCLWLTTSHVVRIWDIVSIDWKFIDINNVRRLLPVECERLQWLPDDWTKYGMTDNWEVRELTDSNRYILCGNWFHVDVLDYITKNIWR